MAPPHSGTCGNDIVFEGNTKCCTFWPLIPNYLVGSILTDHSEESSEGRILFERAAESVAIVIPLGVFPPRAYALSYRWSYSNLAEREAFLCPYYLREAGGLCGIWRHRNGRCSTWFCKHERGAVSRAFWTALDALLESVENALSRWCVSLIPTIPVPPLSQPEYRDFTSSWGIWAGREKEFFIECWREVEKLSWLEVAAIMGPDEHPLAQKTREAFHLLQNRCVPSHLKLADVKVERIDAEHSRVWAYSVFNPLDLESSILEALSLFNGESLEATLQRLEVEKGIHLDEHTLQKLVDFSILVPV